MNFVTKNLGWILLLVFFIFMLFIISSNDPRETNLVSTGTTASGEALTGSADQNLDDLMKLIDDQEIDSTKDSAENDEITISEEANQLENESSSGDVITTEIEENDQAQEDEAGFFARLFGRDNEELEEENQDTQSGSNANQIDVATNQPEDETIDSEDDETNTNNENTVSGVSTETYSSDANIVKTSSNSVATQNYKPEMTYPGVNLETNIGKIFEIGVQMLKLNNKYFTQTLGYMSKGDQVTQLTKENSYGCFKVVVESTGSQGYVCKKYLSDVTHDTQTGELDSDSENTAKSINQTENIDTQVVAEVSSISTEIGSYYKINIESPSFFDVVLERFTLDKGDVLRQLSKADENTGCVSMKVVGTSTGEHDGKIVDICSPDMVNSYIY